jgi:hypothetical protein
VVHAQKTGKSGMTKIAKDKFFAKLSFYLSLGFWIPLFNIGLTAVSLYYAIKALKLINKNPHKYGGRWYTIIAMVLDITTLVATLAGVIIYGLRKISGVT